MDFKSFQDPRAPKASKIRIDQEERERETERERKRDEMASP